MLTNTGGIKRIASYEIKFYADYYCKAPTFWAFHVQYKVATPHNGHLPLDE